MGKDNKLPWSFPEEFQHFVDTTRGHVIIMGRKTFLDTPEFVLNQTVPIVFTRNKENDCFKDCTSKNKIHIVTTIDELKAVEIPIDKDVFFIGGGDLFNLFFESELVSSFFLTIMKKEYPGDAYIQLKYFETWDKSELKSTDDYVIYKMTKS